jgi:protein SCO1/2
MKSRWFSAAGGLTAVIVVAVYLGSAGASRGQAAQPAAAQDGPVVSDRVRSFSLTGSRGTIVTDRSFRGDWLVVFFGFTHCVDICPAALFNLSRALEALGEPAAGIRVAFITVDPDRDSPEVLHTYLQAFGPRFIGLTGTQQQISATEETFRAYAEKQAKTADGNYGMNHSSAFYVLDPNGQFRRQISAESTIAGLTASLRSAMRLNVTESGARHDE